MSQSGPLAAFDPFYGSVVDPAVKCLAPEHTLWWNQRTSDTAINLGPFACPTGYTTATAIPMDKVTTEIGCCPNKYKYQSSLYLPGIPQQCLSPLTAGQVVTVKSPSSGTWYAITTRIATSQNLQGVHINGYVLNNAAEVSSPAQTTASTTYTGGLPSLLPGPTAGRTGAGDSTIRPTGTSSPSSQPSSNLSDGTKIGIGVGVALGVMGVLCLLANYFLLRRRTREKAGAAPQEIVEAPGSNTFGDQLSKMHFQSAEEANGKATGMTRAPVEMWVDPSNSR